MKLCWDLSPSKAAFPWFKAQERLAQHNYSAAVELVMNFSINGGSTAMGNFNWN